MCSDFETAKLNALLKTTATAERKGVLTVTYGPYMN